MNTSQQQIRTIWQGGNPFDRHHQQDVFKQGINYILKNMVTRPYVKRWADYNREHFKHLVPVHDAAFFKERQAPDDYWVIAKGLESILEADQRKTGELDGCDIVHQRAMLAHALKLRPRELVVCLESAAVLYGITDTVEKTTFFIPKKKLAAVEKEINRLVSEEALKERPRFLNVSAKVRVHSQNCFHMQSIDSLWEHFPLDVKISLQMESWLRREFSLSVATKL